jgi:hypothetical protein
MARAEALQRELGAHKGAQDPIRTRLEVLAIEEFVRVDGGLADTLPRRALLGRQALRALPKAARSTLDMDGRR